MIEERNVQVPKVRALSGVTGDGDSGEEVLSVREGVPAGAEDGEDPL